MVVALADSFFFDVDPSGARSKVLAFLLVSFTPFLVVAPFIGPVIDRVRGGRRFVVQAVAVARIVVQLLMIRFSDDTALFGLVFVALVLQKTYQVSKSALVPAVVRSDRELVEANSKLGLIAGFAGVVAVVPAALLQTVIGSSATLAYSARAVRGGARRRRCGCRASWRCDPTPPSAASRGGVDAERAAGVGGDADPARRVRIHAVPAGVRVPRTRTTVATCCSARRSCCRRSARWPATRSAPTIRGSLHEERMVGARRSACRQSPGWWRRRPAAIGPASRSPSSSASRPRCAGCRSRASSSATARRPTAARRSPASRRSSSSAGSSPPCCPCCCRCRGGWAT